MNGENIVALIAALAWPVVVLVVLFTFRRAVASFAERIGGAFSERGHKIVGRAGNVEFSAELHAGKEALAIAEPSLASDITTIVSGEPMDTIDQSTNAIRTRLVGLLQAPNKASSKDINELTVQATKAGLISFDLAAAIRRLHGARNAAIGSDIPASAQDALEFKKVADAVLGALDGKGRQL